MKKTLVQSVVLFIGLAVVAGARPGPTDPTLELLRAKDQALLDAIAPGDRKVWDEALAPDVVYVDENGVIMNRAEYLKQLDPLPAGASGTLRFASYSAHIAGDMACVIHTDDEEENYHGQILHAQYLMTETWRRDAGAWKLYIVHAYAVLKDPPTMRVAGGGAGRVRGPIFGWRRSSLCRSVGRQTTNGWKGGEASESFASGSARRAVCAGSTSRPQDFPER